MKNTNNKPTIYFDLDGTVYPLYTQPRWLERITTEQDASAYAADSIMVDAADLHAALDEAIAAGHKVGVISWVANGIPAESPIVAADPAYVRSVRATKRAWVKKFLPQATEVHIVKYGTPKPRVAADKGGILVDDNATVRASWTGATVDASRHGWVNYLREVIRGV